MQEDFDNLYFWNTLNKTHHGILVWNRNKRLHTIKKKYVHKERKETTHVKIGKEDIHHIYIYIYIKDNHNVCKHGHKIGVQEEKVSIPPNKMKHISPLQRHVFLPQTCRILKRNHIFSTISPPFFHDWQRVQEAIKVHPRNKDDQGDTKNLYKCMNVMK